MNRPFLLFLGCFLFFHWDVCGQVYPYFWPAGSANAAIFSSSSRPNQVTRKIRYKVGSIEKLRIIIAEGKQTAQSLVVSESEILTNQEIITNQLSLETISHAPPRTLLRLPKEDEPASWMHYEGDSLIRSVATFDSVLWKNERIPAITVTETIRTTNSAAKIITQFWYGKNVGLCKIVTIKVTDVGKFETTEVATLTQEN